MATIKAIDGRSVHQIQSGQVIVDLCSVVKELVENSLDAGASSIDVRFKNQGLEAIEVQDNGSGIFSADYETIALKHYTSKLATYEDIGALQTFGFRGEALSSLCALSNFHITTAREDEAPKGTRLDFETSGKLAGTSVAACPKGTTVSVETLFHNLPVRRKELEKNIKREYGKVLGLLHAYACISTGVKFSVSNQPSKGKKVVAFSTKSNTSTRDNIANVYGAKTLTALIPLDLELQLEPTTSKSVILSKDRATSNKVYVAGHISRPIFGEGRQTPDRQMFFVNSRPCLLPQVSKAFNEVYKSYNITQSPFIFANLRMDTNAYDVNVSPDKRTILLHDQTALLDSLKEKLVELFELQDQTVPQALLPISQPRLPAFTPLTLLKRASSTNQDLSTNATADTLANNDSEDDAADDVVNNGSDEEEREDGQAATLDSPHRSPRLLVHQFAARNTVNRRPSSNGSQQEAQLSQPIATSPPPLPRPVVDFNARLASQQEKSRPSGSHSVEPELETGDRRKAARPQLSLRDDRKFARSLRSFAAPGARVTSATPDADLAQSSAEDIEEDEDVEEAEDADDLFVRDDDNDNGDDDEEMEEEAKDDYAEEKQRKVQEEARIEQMVRDAEKVSERPMTQHIKKRAANLFKRSSGKDSTNSLSVSLNTSIAAISKQSRLLSTTLKDAEVKAAGADLNEDEDLPKATAEERLSLTISKSDFAAMRIVGQFNLGFILAVRSHSHSNHPRKTDDLFIIDQHASDEIYNFHRLSSSTILTPQPLVHPHTLQLTAIEEETVLEHKDDALLKNGFRVIFDDSGDSLVGQRCKLLTLPTSRETVFDVRDLEELLVLLADAPAPSSQARADTTSNGPSALQRARDVPRPSKVRRMLAMRACRSSIMVGRELAKTGMQRVVRHMGEIERPWNCPHGRPTMRHLAGLAEWEAWSEDSPWTDAGVDGDRDVTGGGEVDWLAFLDGLKEEDDDAYDDDENDEGNGGE